MTWGASAPIRVRVVTQVEKRWRHGYDASTDVNTPRHIHLTSASIRTQQRRGKWRLQGWKRTRFVDITHRLWNSALSTVYWDRNKFLKLPLSTHARVQNNNFVLWKFFHSKGRTYVTSFYGIAYVTNPYHVSQELGDSYMPHSKVRIMEWMRLWWVGHAACIERDRNGWRTCSEVQLQWKGALQLGIFLGDVHILQI
jgi:hypothetical protein